jgi:hypothetical protein
MISLALRAPARFLAAILVALGLSGCVTADKPALSVEGRQNLKLVRTEVGFAPGANIHVSAVEDQEAARGASREQIGQAERAHISEAMSSDFMAIVGPRLAGSRPVVAKITVTSFYIPGAVAALVAGGSSAFSAGVDLVDVKSGETLVSIPPGKISTSVYRPGGVIGFAVQASAAGDPVDAKTHEISRQFAVEYVNWLLTN